MSPKKFVEIFSNRQPKTAREFAGYPIRMVEKEIGPAEDDRIMADGRPAYAWWNEIQMLRAREPELQKRAREIREQMLILRIAEWAAGRDILTDDTLLRIKRLPLTRTDPVEELWQHPEKYVEVERGKGNSE